MGIVCASDRKSDKYDSHPLEKFTDVSSVRSKYEFESSPPIGTGQFGAVFKAYSKKDQKPYAIKVIPKNKCGLGLETLPQDEYKLLQGLKHPNILKFHERYEDEESLYFVLELLQGKVLKDHVNEKGGVSEQEAVHLMKQAFQAVDYLHKHNIAHRDIKLDNFMFSDSTSNAKLVLIDFGFAKRFVEGEEMKIRMGTPVYCSPEVIDSKYDYRSDYWSLGIMMYYLLTGRYPFNSNNVNDLFDKIRKNQIDLKGDKWKSFSSEAKDLVKRLLTRDPSLRISAQAALNHPWMKMQHGIKESDITSKVAGSIVGSAKLSKLDKRFSTPIAVLSGESQSTDSETPRDNEFISKQYKKSIKDLKADHSMMWVLN